MRILKTKTTLVIALFMLSILNINAQVYQAKIATLTPNKVKVLTNNSEKIKGTLVAPNGKQEF